MALQVNEISLDYTFCPNNTNKPANILSWDFNAVTLNCNITFNIATTWTGPVYMYYGLTKYVRRACCDANATPADPAGSDSGNAYTASTKTTAATSNPTSPTSSRAR